MKNHNAYVSGIPDVWYSGHSDSLWVEYKYVPVTRPTAPVVPDLSVQQLHWIKSRKEEGRNVWVIIGCKPGGVIFYDANEMRDGISASAFLGRMQTRKELALQIYHFCQKEHFNGAQKHKT